MGTDKLSFAEDRWGSDHCACLTGRGPVRKYVLRMRIRKLRNIRPSGAFFIGSDKITWTEEALSGLTFFPVLFVSRTFPPLLFSRTFFFVLFSRIFFSVFSPVFYHVLFSRTLFFRTISRILFPYFFLPYYFVPVLFQKSRRLKSNVLKYQWVVFLVHVVITQFMFIAEYPIKRHP
jgi:hypothetical protein